MHAAEPCPLGAGGGNVTGAWRGAAGLMLAWALACSGAPAKPPAQSKVPAPLKLTLEQAASRAGRDRVPAFEGQDVVVTGQVSQKPIWIADSYYVAIQDPAFFGLLLRPEIPQLPDLLPGDWVEARGVIAKRGGLPILVPQTIHRLRQEMPPAPRAITAFELAGFRYMGVLVTLDTIISGENRNGGGDLLLMGPASSELNVFLPRARRDAGPQLSGFRVGDRIRVTGIASQYCTLPPYDRYFQILIPTPAAVAVLSRGWMIQPPVLLAALILAAALAVIWWFRERRMATLRKQMRMLHSLGEQVIGATSSTEILRRLMLNLPALSNAAGEGHETVVKLLLEKGANIESKDDKYGWTALSKAAGQGHKAVVKLLLDKGANIESKDDKDGRTPLSNAAGEGRKAVVKLLLEKGADIESKDEEGGTPLSNAAGEGHEAVVKLLLEKGADIESKDDKYGWTPLSRAVVKLPLEKGANIKAKKTKYGWVSLSVVAGLEHEAVVKLLLEKGADIESKDKEGRTPLSRAAAEKHWAVVWLLEAGSPDHLQA